MLKFLGNTILLSLFTYYIFYPSCISISSLLAKFLFNPQNLSELLLEKLPRHTQSQTFSLFPHPQHSHSSRYMVIFFFLIFIYLFIYLWLCWVFVSVRGLSPVAASGRHSSSRCAGLSLSRPLLLRSTGSRRAGSATVAHGPSCSAACGVFPDQGSNPCPLHWQADSQPLRHQGSPVIS